MRCSDCCTYRRTSKTSSTRRTGLSSVTLSKTKPQFYYIIHFYTVCTIMMPCHQIKQCLDYRGCSRHSLFLEAHMNKAYKNISDPNDPEIWCVSYHVWCITVSEIQNDKRLTDKTSPYVNSEVGIKFEHCMH